MQKTRLPEVDLLKGVLIICMIIGHVGFGGKIEWLIHAFHMQGFFIITGYLTKDSTIENWYAGGGVA